MNKQLYFIGAKLKKGLPLVIFLIAHNWKFEICYLVSSSASVPRLCFGHCCGKVLISVSMEHFYRCYRRTSRNSSTQPISRRQRDLSLWLGIRRGCWPLSLPIQNVRPSRGSSSSSADCQKSKFAIFIQTASSKGVAFFSSLMEKSSFHRATRRSCTNIIWAS